MRTAALVLAAVMLLLGCPPRGTAPSTPPSPTPSSGYQPPPSSDQTSPPVAAQSCMVGTDCASGICEGQGCDDAHPGTCVPADRMCTRDAHLYCGCDGQTFTGSGSCPGQRYASAGSCSAP